MVREDTFIRFMYFSSNGGNKHFYVLLHFSFRNLEQKTKQKSMLSVATTKKKEKRTRYIENKIYGRG